jgi:putative ABC transport system permease protein
VEDSTGGPAVAVLSNGLWERVFHGDPNAVGRSIDLRGEPFTVVGVMPKSLVNVNKADLWTPLRASTTGEGSGINYEILARVKPGIGWNEANAEVKVIEQPVLNGQLAKWHAPSSVRTEMELVFLQRALTDSVRSSVLPKWGAVGLILLIGCVNVAGLLIAQAASRRREIATRMAVGASRRRVIAQLLTESVLLAIGGGILGLVLGAVAIEGLRRVGMEGFNLWRPVTLSLPVLMITLLLSLATSIVFGLIPALEISRGRYPLGAGGRWSWHTGSRAAADETDSGGR